MPFDPLRLTTPAHGTDQRVHPAVDDTGEPVWEAGDTKAKSWRATGLDTCHGTIDNRRTRRDIDVRLYLTDARLVVVSDRFAKGTTYKSASFIGGPVISSAIKTKVSQHRADRAAEGTFLVGQMRLPWINRIVYQQRTRRKGEHAVRICGTHRSAFGDQETVMLIVHLPADANPHQVASEIAARVIADRKAWSGTSIEQRAALSNTRFSNPARLAPGTLPSIELPGAYVVSARSGGCGVHSSHSVDSTP